MGIAVQIDPGNIDFLPDNVIKLSSIQEKLNAALVTATEHIDVPPICIKIKDGDDESEIGTLGNISLFIGKAKQGKTFAISMAVAAAEISGNWLMDKIKVSLPDDKKTVLMFDTEQSRFHVQRVVKRIAKLSNTIEPNNLKAYGLRGNNAGEALEMVEYALYNTENVGFVVIDGIRDLVTSINDEEQASFISSKLLKWSQDLNCHIVVVLHTNKGDNNARGHLGSELTNKSESVLSIAKDVENKDTVIIAPEYCRNREFSPFAFKIDEFGIPYIVDNPMVQADTSKKKKITPIDIDPTTHLLVIDAIFKVKKELKYSELFPQVQDYFMRYGITFGENKAKEFVTFYLNDAYITCYDPPKGYTLYKNNFKKISKVVNINHKNASDITPFDGDEAPF